MSAWLLAINICIWTLNVHGQRYTIFQDAMTTSFDSGWSSTGNFYGLYGGQPCYYRAGSTKNCTALFGTTSSSEMTTFEHSFTDIDEYYDIEAQFDLVISSMIPNYPAGGVIVCGVAYKYGASSSWQPLGDTFVLPAPITYGTAAFGGAIRSIPDPTNGEDTLYFRFYTDPSSTSNAACFANNFYLRGFNGTISTSTTTASPTTTSSSSSISIFGLSSTTIIVFALFVVFFGLLCCIGIVVVCVRKRKKGIRGENLALVDTSRSANY